MQEAEKIRTRFAELLDKKEERLVWEFLTLDFNQITETEELNYKIELLGQDWHRVHEEIVSEFQWIANPITIDSLYRTALNEKIEIMDYLPIARKCTWALADIGTPEAKAKLRLLASTNNPLIRQFAEKRLANWEKEAGSKGMKVWIRNKARNYLYLDFYSNRKKLIGSLPKQIVTAHHNKDSLIVYQAFNEEVAAYAVAHQRFGGKAYNFGRMSWIKPNFLWMMYRSGWAEKENQERVLAISIPISFFLTLLRAGEMTSFAQSNYQDEDTWKSNLAKSEVRIQWDPHHDPHGNKLDRKAIQVGLKGNLLREFATDKINYIEDITTFVKRQKKHLDQEGIKSLQVPIEVELPIDHAETIRKLGIGNGI